MSFGFGGGGFGFGASQPAQSPFGGTAAPFGQAPFGQQQQQASSPFGATTSTGLFGASQPAFGASSTPAFGASSTPAFGSSGFGATPAPSFGSPNPFGAASQPLFGAASTPAFGGQPATPSFGAGGTGFGSTQPAFGSGFGAASAPAFGAASSPGAFGSATPAFGSSTPAFGAGGFGGAFGAPQGAVGTRTVPHQKTQDVDSSTSSGGQKQTIFFNSISAMPQYQNKCPEELRWEDYQAGVKGNTGVAPAAQPGPFGQPAANSIFGNKPPASSPFGPTNFGTPNPAPFGSTPSPSPFGVTPSSAPFTGFGTTAFTGTTSSAPFGTPAATGFNQPGTSAFGTFAPAFQQTGAGFASTTSSLFGPQTTSVFGVSSAAASSPSLFNQQPAPAFGSTPAQFGANPSPFGSSPSTFNFATSGSAFAPGNASSIFSNTGGGFMQTPASGGLNFGQTAVKPFAGNMFGSTASPTPGFGTTMTNSLFGPTSTTTLGGGSIFNGAMQSPGFFNTPTQQQQQPQQQMITAQPLGVAVSPYGVLPQAPNVGTPIPEYKGGISARPVSALGPPRPTAVMASRPLTPRSGIRLRPSRARSVSRGASSPADFLSEESDTGANGSAYPSIFLARDNPRQFFVREPLPSTAASTTPSSAAAATPAPGPSPAASGPLSSRKPAPQRSNSAAGADRRDEEQPRGTRAQADDDDQAGPSQNGHFHEQPSLTDDEVGQLLPTVQAEDYTVEPSLTQLAAMAREDPDSLAGVANFKISRRGIGSVKWLDPTDVRGLNVDGTVALSRGSVEVYLDENEKPEIGEGLNKSAEVTLHKVYRIDKATNRPTTDKEAIARFERKLKKLSADQNARFISYNADMGTWVFEVEHFSKYGLVDSDEEDAPLEGAGVPDDQEPADMGDDGGEPEGEGMLLSDEEDEEEDDMDGYSQHGTAVRGVGHGMDASDVDARRAAASPLLPLALSAQLGLDPSDLAAFRSDLFPHHTPDQNGHLARRKRPPVGTPGVSPGGATPPPAAPKPAATASESPTGLPASRPAALPSAVVLAATSWKRPAPALQPPSASGSTVDKRPAGALALSEGTATTLRGASQPSVGAERCMVDAGLLMGRSFRVGWGPNGRLVHPGIKTTAAGATPIVVRSLPITAKVLTKAPPEPSAGSLMTRTREHWRQLLSIHAAHSSPSASTQAAGRDGWAPRTRQHALHCSRSKELHSLCCEYLVAAKDFLQKNHVDTDGSMEGLVTKHEVWTWELLHVLFSRIEDADPSDEAMLPTEQPALVEQEGEAGESEGPAAKKRRGLLSRWLRDRARSEVEGALQRCASLPEKLCQLLSGQQLSAAIALASCTGDVRLASLISQTAAKGEARDALGRQLQTWQEADFVTHIDRERLYVYQLLAGHIDAVAPQMRLDWRRALGLHFWYGQSPGVPVGHALQAYTASFTAGKAPPPVPLYLEQGQEKLQPASSAAVTKDVNFLLLELFCGGAASADGAFLAQLLAPTAHTPELLNYMLPWLLLQMLQGIHALPTEKLAPQVFAVHMGLISQLEAIGGLEEWALYVAQHLPDGPTPEWRNLRDQLVQQLLLRHAPALAASPDKQAFLRERLGVPPDWLAGALMVWARYSRDAAEEFVQAVASADWATAHGVLVQQLAPQWWCTGQTEKLQSHLKQLQANSGPVQAAVGSAAWKSGAGLYTAYASLEALHKQGDEARGPARLQAARELADLLDFASQQLADASGERASDSALLQKVVLGGMAQKLASWVLRDGKLTAADAVQRQLLSTSVAVLPPINHAHHMHIGACALGKVMV